MRLCVCCYGNTLKLKARKSTSLWKSCSSLYICVCVCVWVLIDVLWSVRVYTSHILLLCRLQKANFTFTNGWPLQTILHSHFVPFADDEIHNQIKKNRRQQKMKMRWTCREIWWKWPHFYIQTIWILLYLFHVFYFIDFSYPCV